mgnify:CR=1 FL=1
MFRLIEGLTYLLFGIGMIYFTFKMIILNVSGVLLP